MQFVLVGIGAGAAAALLFASATAGVWLSIPLFYLAPLPIMIAGLGWGHWAALAAAVSGAVGLWLAFGTVFLLAFAAGAGVPAWWLSYLALLARPVGTGSDATLEWYAPGRLIIWAAVLAALVVLIAIPNFGTDAESFRAGLRGALTAVLRVEHSAPAGGAADRAGRIIDFLVSAVPLAAAILATVTNLVNLWIAGRVVKFSGRLARPWPQLSAITFPPVLVVVLGIAIALSFTGGMLGILAGVLAASLMLAYGVLGFAVLHALTANVNARTLILSIAYAVVIVLGWPILALCLLGVIDSVVDLRGRTPGRHGPPALS
ncbi:MAG TPA: DUF2232 domain-containing protein [Pseudolabrys sp.]|nr:DUF2232 domain-containing protein [Pseudolabrys sp.]